MKKIIIAFLIYFMGVFSFAETTEDGSNTTSATTPTEAIIGAPQPPPSPISMSYYIEGSSNLEASSLSGVQVLSISYKLQKESALTLALYGGLNYTAQNFDDLTSLIDPYVRYSHSFGELAGGLNVSAQVRYYMPVTERSLNSGKHTFYTLVAFDKDLTSNLSLHYNINPTYYRFAEASKESKPFMRLANTVNFSYKVNDGMSLDAGAYYSLTMNRSQAPQEEDDETSPSDKGLLFTNKKGI